MFEQLPTQRISPKHQVTLPKGSRGLVGVDTTNQVCAMPHRMQREDGTRYPVILLMSEEQLQQREEQIRQREDLQPVQKEQRIARLNGHVRQLAVDGQRRIVLPPHFVELLKLEREVFIFASNRSVMIWNPVDWQRYSEQDDDYDDVLV